NEVGTKELFLSQSSSYVPTSSFSSTIPMNEDSFLISLHLFMLVFIPSKTSTKHVTNVMYNNKCIFINRRYDFLQFHKLILINNHIRHIRIFLQISTITL